MKSVPVQQLICSQLYIHDFSDTVTRSGMFCAMATVIDRCKTEGIVDVFQVIKSLRVQKREAVPTLVRNTNAPYICTK